MTTTHKALALFVLTLLVFPAMVFAQPTGQGNQNPPAGSGNPGTTLINPLSDCPTGQNCLESFLMSILEIVIRIGTIVIVLMLVYVGFLFATSSVNPANKDKAKTALLWTLVGALILLGAQAIALAIKATVDALSS